MQSALVLFGHGARDPEWASPLLEVQQRILRAHPGSRVELAFLEFMQPDLPGLVSQMFDDGVNEIGVLPMFVAQGGHIKRELPEIIQRLEANFPGLSLQILPAIGSSEIVQAAMVKQASMYIC